MAAILTGVTLPNFVLAPVLILIFALKLGWLPVAGWSDPLTGDIQPEYVLLPAVVLAARPAALIARLTRASMLETLAPGLHPHRPRQGPLPRAHFVPARPQKCLPAGADHGGRLVRLSYSPARSWWRPSSTSPASAIESIHSLSTRDYSLIEGTTLLLAVIFVTVNLIGGRSLRSCSTRA